MIYYSSANSRVAEQTSSRPFVYATFRKLLAVFFYKIHIQRLVGFCGAFEHVVQ